MKKLYFFPLLIFTAIAADAQIFPVPASIDSGSARYKAARILLQCNHQRSEEIVSKAVDDLVEMGDSAILVLLTGLYDLEGICSLLKDSSALPQCTPYKECEAIMTATCSECATKALERLGRRALPSLLFAYHFYPEKTDEISLLINKCIIESDSLLLDQMLHYPDAPERQIRIARRLVSLGVRFAPKRFAAIADSLMTTSPAQNDALAFCTFAEIVHDFGNKDRAQKGMANFLGDFIRHRRENHVFQRKAERDASPYCRFDSTHVLMNFVGQKDMIAETFYYIQMRRECVELCSLDFVDPLFKNSGGKAQFALIERLRLDELVPQLIIAMGDFGCLPPLKDTPCKKGQTDSSFPRFLESRLPAESRNLCFSALVNITGQSFGLTLDCPTPFNKGYYLPAKWEFRGSKGHLKKSIRQWTAWYAEKRDSLQNARAKSPPEKPDPLYHRF